MNSPIYDPSTDAAVKLWFDPSNSAKVLAVGGGAISNGATVGTLNTSGGTARAFTQWGSNARPTWESAGINGLGAIRSANQLITTQAGVSEFIGIGGLTIIRVARRVTSTPAINLSCLDPNTGFSDITQWGLASYFSNGWRRPRVDTFQSFTGDSAPNYNITTAVWDFTNAVATIYQTGCKGPVYQAAFGSAGVTTGTAYALSFGGFAQQTGSAAGGLTADGYMGEVLGYYSALTADQLYPKHDYLRRKWAIG